MPFWKKKKKIGLALSGGGMRGIGHIGVIKALEEHNLKPHVLSGTSAGAIVAALYASNYTPREIIEKMGAFHFFRARSLKLRASSIFDTAVLTTIFDALLPHNSFESLSIPLHIAATDIEKGQTVYFSKGSLHDALLASASIPFIFPVQTMGGQYLLDGGILNNLPIEPLLDDCNLIFGSSMNAISHESGVPTSGRKLFDRVIHLALGLSVYAKARQCDLFFDPPEMTRFNMFDKKNALAIYQHSYDYSRKLLEQNIRSLKL